MSPQGGFSMGARYGEAGHGGTDTAALETSLDGPGSARGDWGLSGQRMKRILRIRFDRSLDDQASHWVLQTAISSLNRLTIAERLPRRQDRGRLRSPDQAADHLPAGRGAESGLTLATCSPPVWCFSIGIRAWRLMHAKFSPSNCTSRSSRSPASARCRLDAGGLAGGGAKRPAVSKAGVRSMRDGRPR